MGSDLPGARRVPTATLPPDADGLRVDPDRLLDSIASLGSVGTGPGKGVTRLAFSQEDAEARAHVERLMGRAGLDTRVDAAGNLVGSPRGLPPGQPRVVLGSHVDSVPGGGCLDGAYGVLAAVEVATALRDAGQADALPVQVVVFANEEGTYGTPMWGSRAAASLLAREEVERTVANHSRLPEALASVGGSLSEAHDCAWSWSDAVAFVELHIEQGPALEAAGTPIGVVTGIVGRSTLGIEVVGETNHAGTTPMPARRDALAAAAEAVLIVQGLARDRAIVGTATVGTVRAEPNFVNVVPGVVRLEADLRDLDGAALDHAEAVLAHDLDCLAERLGVLVRVVRTARVRPVRLDDGVREAIGKAADDLRVPSQALPSGAGHDAQIIANRVPTGMIFVPSAGGVSHAPEEHTDARDLVLGADVLLRTVLRLHARRRAGPAVADGSRARRTPVG